MTFSTLHSSLSASSQSEDSSVNIIWTLRKEMKPDSVMSVEA